MLTTKAGYDLNKGRVQSSTVDGISAPDRLAIFLYPIHFGSAENTTPARGIISRDLLHALNSRSLNDFEVTFSKKAIDMNNQIVVFNNHNLEIINKDGQRYFSAPQVGAALGYSRSDQIIKIYNAHKDEFTNNMTETAETALSGNLTTITRIFSLRGCHLLAMFSRTPVAKEFRRWVLDLIEQQNQSVTNCQQLDAKAIGGIVKKCCAVAVRQELANLLAGDPQADWECSDRDLIYHLYRWHNTKNKADTLAFRKLYAERDALMAENADLKNRMKQIKDWVK